MPHPRTRLETERTTLRPATADDLDVVHRLWTDPDIRRFLTDERVIARDETRDGLAHSETTWTHHGYGIWIVDDRVTDETLGFVSLRGDPPPELMYGLLRTAWGRGLATECAGAVVSYAFDTLGLSRVRADVDEPNIASVRVLEKLGMTRTHAAIVRDKPLAYYVLSREPRDGLAGVTPP